MSLGQVALYIFVAVILLLLYSQFVFFLKVRRLSNQKISEAARLEAQGDYAGACLLYALALMNNPSRRKDWQARIRSLWQQHGPFDYRERLAAGLDCSPMNCADAVDLIEAIVAGDAV
jgi:hypothetical protein